MSGAARFDCEQFSQSACLANNCCWSPTSTERTANFTEEDFATPPAGTIIRGANTPWCFKQQQIVGGYSVVSASATSSPPGWTIGLQLYDGNGYFGVDTPRLVVNVAFETAERLRIKISDPSTDRWEIPESILPITPPDLTVNNFMYSFSYTNEPFGFAVTRLDDSEVIFNTTSPIDIDGIPMFNGLVFSDQYIEISSSLPSNPVVYGLGEKVTSLQLETSGNPITFWARDAATPVDQNIYGSHPMYLEYRRTVATEAEQRQRGGAAGFTTKTHGVWIRNSNGMDVILADGASAARQRGGRLSDDQAGVITYRVIGGILDFFVYVGNSALGTSSPESIIKQYHNSVGFPHMPPLWSLGFHQCRWGYPNLAAVETMVANYAAAKIPLDTAWTDIDYMGAYEDFSTDPVNYPSADLAAFIEKLHGQGQHYMVIIDPAIHNRTGYPTFDQGLEQDVFIKQASGNVFVGQVWPGYTAFPSFYAANTQSWWSQNIETFRQAVPVDGLWIDMNEASNFCTGDCDSPTNVAAVDQLDDVRRGVVSTAAPTASAATPKSLCDGRPGSPVHTCLPNNPPYRINNGADGNPLNTKTIDMDSTHGEQKWLEYNVHNMYGFSESIATNAALESSMGSRSLVISRSSFSGSGKHTGHWTGDNQSTWASMASSIPGILAMQFFGITMVGSDICGFQGNSNEELCARWMALGSFYPFSRNHNTKGAASQEPYLWASVTAISQKTLGSRYELLHVYNTLFFQANQQGGTVVRPLSFNFVQDPTTFSIGTQFMIGSSVLITPVLTQGATNVQGYFPQINDIGLPQRWYDWWSGEEFQAGSSGFATLSAPISTIPVHIAGGSILPLQEPELTTVAQEGNPFDVLVALDSQGEASGSLFMDDGSTLHVGQNSLQATFIFSNGTLSYQIQQSEYAPAGKIFFTEIDILGIDSAPQSVMVNGEEATFAWDGSINSMSISKLQLPLSAPFQAVLKF